jgi:hypothetical protein
LLEALDSLASSVVCGAVRVEHTLEAPGLAPHTDETAKAGKWGRVPCQIELVACQLGSCEDRGVDSKEGAHGWT